HTLRRGKRIFSCTTTEWPARASSSAAVAPAGPPPAISTSTFTRREEMREGPGHAFLELPVARRPDGGELLAGEARAHADHRVVARDLVCPEHPQHLARLQRDARAPRLAGDEKRRALRGERQHVAQDVAVQVVQEQ